MKHLKKLIILIPVIIGVALLMVMKTNKKPPVRLEDRERVQAVRVIPMEKTTAIPRTTGYGHVGADRTWQAIPEASGQVVFMDDTLKKGSFIHKGDLLLRLDTRAFGLAESKGMAEVMNLDARLKELEQSQENTEHLLVIEKKALAIASQEVDRKRKLHEKQVISSSTMEKEETNFLARQTAVKNLKNKLKLIPTQKKALLAQKRSGESSVAERRLDLAKTEIRAPFNGRVSRINIEQFQFAPAGTIMLEAESIDRAEIPLQLTPQEFIKLLPRNFNKSLALGQVPDMEALRKDMGILAKVRLPLGKDKIIEWEGRFSRSGDAMDPATGTMTFYITVENPYENIIPGKRPPLTTNMYVGVELSGQPLTERFVIPRSAVHEGNLYICSRENRLEIRPVTVEFSMDDLAILTTGVTEGELVVLTDLVPAVEGMKLLPETDQKKADYLKRQATGEKI